MTLRELERLERAHILGRYPGGQSPMEALDAANECRHGRLPSDRGSCGCWPEREAEGGQLLLSLGTL